MRDKKAKLFYLDVREPKELEELGPIDGHANIPTGSPPPDVLLVAG